MPRDKLLVVNSEAVRSEDSVIPQVYQNVNCLINRENGYGMMNSYGESAAVAQVIRNHISNDTDSILYAGNQMNRENGNFLSELWVELVYTQRVNGVCGSSHKKRSAFWDINNLIYEIESKLDNIENQVSSVVALYISAGSDFTEKWHGETHKSFLKTFLNHIEFIGDISNSENPPSLNSYAYCKLIHCVWMNSKKDPSKTSFTKLRESIKIRKNKNTSARRAHSLQHYKRVNGCL